MWAVERGQSRPWTQAEHLPATAHLRLAGQVLVVATWGNEMAAYLRP